MPALTDDPPHRHLLCDGCWEKINPGEPPHRNLDEPARPCCRCFGLATSGIVVGAPSNLFPCLGEVGVHLRGHLSSSNGQGLRQLDGETVDQWRARVMLQRTLERYAVAVATLRDTLTMELGILSRLHAAVKLHGFYSSEVATIYHQWVEFSQAHSDNANGVATSVDAMITAVEVALSHAVPKGSA